MKIPAAGTHLKKRGPRFVKAFTRLLRDPRISTTDKCVLFALKSYADVNDHCFPAIQTIAADLGVRRSTVVASLKRLESYRLITRIPRFKGGKQTSSDYHIDDLHFTIHRSVRAGAESAPLDAGAKTAPRSRAIEEEQPLREKLIQFTPKSA